MGPVVVLRAFEPADAPAIARACNDAEIARFIPDLPSPYTEEDACSFIALNEQWRAEGSQVGYAVTAVGSGEFLGAIALHYDVAPAIGYWVAPEARGRGVASAAVRLLSEWAIGEGEIERLELTTHPENRASQRVAEKCGFSREGLVVGYLQTKAGPRDSVIFSLRAPRSP